MVQIANRVFWWSRLLTGFLNIVWMNCHKKKEGRQHNWWDVGYHPQQARFAAAASPTRKLGRQLYWGESPLLTVPEVAKYQLPDDQAAASMENFYIGDDDIVDVLAKCLHQG